MTPAAPFSDSRSPVASGGTAASPGAAPVPLHERGTTHVTDQLANPGGGDVDAHRAQVLARAAATRSNFADLVTAARALLNDQPSSNLVWAQTRRLSLVIAEIAEDITGRRS